MTLTFLQYLIVTIIVYLCLYSLISRICQCVEHCATAKAYEKYQEAEKNSETKTEKGEKIFE